MAEEEKQKKSGSMLKGVLVTALLIVLATGGTAYAISKNPQWLGLSKGQKQVQSEVDALVAEVGKLIDLPKDEKPTVATVTDPSKLKDQPFFAKAKAGDKVLIYTSTKRAILYRPSEHRIIDVGAVNIRQQTEAAPTGTTSVAPTTTPEATPKPTKNPKAATPKE